MPPNIFSIPIDARHGCAKFCIHCQVLPPQCVAVQHRGLLLDYGAHPEHNELGERIPLLCPALARLYRPFHYLRHEDAVFGVEKPKFGQFGQPSAHSQKINHFLYTVLPRTLPLPHSHIFLRKLAMDDAHTHTHTPAATHTQH